MEAEAATTGSWRQPLMAHLEMFSPQGTRHSSRVSKVTPTSHPVESPRPAVAVAHAVGGITPMTIISRLIPFIDTHSILDPMFQSFLLNFYTITATCKYVPFYTHDLHYNRRFPSSTPIQS